MANSVEDLVRWGYETAWNDGDLDALLTLADRDIVFRTSGAFPDLEAEYRGHEGIRRYWETVRNPFEHLRMEVARVIERGEDILILFRFHARGREGLEADMRLGQVGRMRDGLVTTLIAYPDWASAAAAVGLSLGDLG
jgi:ketosteroid isomerase-like protein